MTPGKKNSDNVEVISFLALTLGMLDTVGMVSSSEYDPSTLAIVEAYLQTQGVHICKLSNKLILIYRADDPIVPTILNANLEELAEFLASEDHATGTLAKWRLDTLVDG